MSLASICRTFLHVVASTLLLCSIVLCVLCIFFPSWQTVKFDQPPAEHQHGLWWDCSRSKEGHSHTTQVENDHKWVCEVKWKHKGTPDEKQHGWLAFHKTVLGLFFGAFGTGLIGLLCSFATPCVKWFGIPWFVLNFIASGLVIAGQAVFFIETHDQEWRLVHGYAGKYSEQVLGWVFYAGLACCVCFLVSAFLSVGVTILVFVSKRHTPAYGSKTWPQHHTAV